MSERSERIRPIDALEAFLLAFVLTAIHFFVLVVSYRRKEYLADLSISSIIEHALKRQKPERKKTGYTELRTNFHYISSILAIAYPGYPLCDVNYALFFEACRKKTTCVAGAKIKK